MNTLEPGFVYQNRTSNPFECLKKAQTSNLFSQKWPKSRLKSRKPELRTLPNHVSTVSSTKAELRTHSNPRTGFGPDMFLPNLQNVTFWRATKCGLAKNWSKTPKITVKSTTSGFLAKTGQSEHLGGACLIRPKLILAFKANSASALSQNYNFSHVLAHCMCYPIQ